MPQSRQTNEEHLRGGGEPPPGDDQRMHLN